MYNLDVLFWYLEKETIVYSISKVVVEKGTSVKF